MVCELQVQRLVHLPRVGGGGAGGNGGDGFWGVLRDQVAAQEQVGTEFQVVAEYHFDGVVDLQKEGQGS